jgi:hypothetical protein
MTNDASVVIKDIPASQTWVNTGVWVLPGDDLSLSAHGTWVDSIIPCSADGYHAPLFYASNKPPRIHDGDLYFRLMGRIVRDGLTPASDEARETFPIGSQANLTALWAGLLFVFANDRPGYYWNNWGTIKLMITKRRSS